MATAPINGALLVSAPGKVILHGEHAVVYGKPALASSVDLRCYTLLKPCPSPTISLDLPDLGLKRSWSLSELMVVPPEERLRELAGVGDTPDTGAVACLAFLYLLTHICGDKLRGGLEVLVVASLPAGAGLGSSAAYSVSLAAALLTHVRSLQPPTLVESTHSLAHPPEGILSKLIGGCGPVSVWGEEDLTTINKWGFEAERLIHGQPSGIDNSISTFGGAISFKAGKITKLKSMPRLRVLLVNTQVPRSTKKLVAGVRERREKFPSLVDHILDAMESLVNTAMESFHDMESHDSHMTPSYQRLQELFTINHHLLNALGVGHSSLDHVCEIVTKFGLSGKLTGAGGGGCAIALLPPDTTPEVVEECSTALTEAGYKCWSTLVGTRGVCQHSLDTS